jgi:glycosidase
MRTPLMGWLVASMLIVCWAQGEPTRPVKFRFVLPEPVRQVYLAGTFNEWQYRRHPMQTPDGGRTWTLTLQLPPGAHQYKFVIDGTEWRTDPNAPAIDDGNGNLNSVVWVEPDGYHRPARVGDGQITRSAILHNPNDLRDRNPLNGTLYLRLRARRDDVQTVELHFWQAGHRHTLRMEPAAQDALYTYYRAALPEGDIEYLFLLRDGNTRLWLTPQGLQKARSSTTTPRFCHRRGENRFEVPDWVQDAIFYQILPDRFYNADPLNDPPNDQPIDFTGRVEGDRFYGGDLKGIQAKLDYLRQLGVTALYLNPVFTSVTHHNYDVDDYERVDPQLGTEEDLRRLVDTLHQHDMRLILDGVFNHVGIHFFAFQDLLAHQERSPYREWFYVERFPVKVEERPSYWAWWNIPYMPKLRHENPLVRRYLLNVVERWMREFRLDGWRLDVPNEVPDRFWREFRPVVRQVNPQAVIIGEIWGDAGRWLQGDMFDSVMNYLWRGAVLDWVAHRRIKPSQFDQRMQTLLIRYPRQSLYAMYNMLSSHDTPRFRQECGGDLRRVKQGLLLQFTAIGAPAIYYGDEIGLEGRGTPDNRRPMRWELTPEERELLDYVKRLIALRKASIALRRGEWRTLLMDDSCDLYAFARFLPSSSEASHLALVLLNNSDYPQTVNLSLPWRVEAWQVAVGTHDFGQGSLPAARGHLSLRMPPLSGAILVPIQSNTQEVYNHEKQRLYTD